MKKEIGFLFLVFLFLPKICFGEVSDLGKINILASRTSTMTSDISKGVSVITTKDIELSTATTLPELIGSQPGVVVSNYLGHPRGVNVDIRGFGETSTSNVLVLVDGRRTNQVDMSGVDWGQVSLDSVERIEIMRGAATVLYGDNASAGVINIVTKKGYRTSEAPMRIGVEFGSYQYKKGYFSTGGTVKFVDYFFNFTHQETEGYRVNSGYWANDFLGTTAFYPTDKLSIDLSTGYHRDQYGMPGALFDADIVAFGREGSKYPEDKGWTSDYFVNLDPKIHFDFVGSDAEFSWLNSYRKRFNKSLNVSAWGRYETVHHINSFELCPKLQLETNIDGDWSNNLTSGFDYFYAKDKVRSGNQSSAQDMVSIVKQTFGIYALERMEFREKLLLNVGGRVTWAEYDFIQTAVVVNKESKSINDGAMNFGIGYKYNENSQVYFDYSRSFRLPVTDEFYQNKYTGLWGPGGGLNTDLKHQVSNNYEIGLKDISFPWMKMDVNVFLMDIKNEIYYDPITYKNSNYSPMTRHCGIEIEGRVSLFKDLLRPFANWTYQNAFFKGGDYSGNKVPFVPKNKISAGISAECSDRVTATLSANYIGKRFAISDQSNVQAKLNSFITFDFKVEYKYKNLKFWFGVKNMLNREYNAYGVYSSGSNKIGFYPAQGRSYVSGMSFEF